MKIVHILNCIENPIYLAIGPNFNRQYLERIKRYPHSVKSNDSYKGGRFDCQKIKEIYFLSLDPPLALKGQNELDFFHFA